MSLAEVEPYRNFGEILRRFTSSFVLDAEQALL
jgi:hypothetical protein